MTRRLEAQLVALFSLAAVFCWSFAAAAQVVEGPASALAASKEEREVLRLLQDKQPLTARRKTEKLLARNKKSIVAHYALGRIMNESEGSIAKSLFHLARARELYERKFQVHPRQPGSPWKFHRELLFEIQAVAQKLEAFSYQLEIIDYHNALYEPDMVAERAWPFLQTGKYKRAREAAQLAIDGGASQQRSLGLNALCAIEGEMGKRKGYFKACLAAYENAHAHDATKMDSQHRSQLAVHAYNAALAARATLRPDQAQKLALEGTRRLAFTPANPWRLLTRLYMAAGRMSEASQALLDMQRWRRKQPPAVRSQTKAETDVVFSTVMLVAGRPTTGLTLLDIALARPDRRGLSSSSAEQALGAHALLRRSLRIVASEKMSERASYAATGSWFSARFTQLKNRFANWTDKQRVRSTLQDKTRLLATLRVFLRGGIEPLPVWMLGDLVDVLGRGVMAATLQRARRLDHDPKFKPYYDAIETDIAWSQGNDRRVEKLAKASHAGLPQTETLLRARVAARAAQAASRRGQKATAKRWLLQAVQLDRGIFRRLQISLPTQVRSTSNRYARAVAKRIYDSPRFHRGKGFVIDVRGKDRNIEICLQTEQRTQLGCSKVAAAPQRRTATNPPVAATGTSKHAAKPAPETFSQYVARLLEAFHNRAFAMPLGLSTTDLASLDGSTTVADQAARERLKSLLDEASGGAEVR